jgi:urease gamma subunit
LISIKITVKGESDVAPSTRTNEYPDKIDEEIFVNSVNMVKDKLAKNLKINVNEAIIVYSAFIVSSIRDGKSVKEIQENASHLLNPEQVMIGVPQTIREMSFDVSLDNNPTTLIVLNTPIQILDYILRST